MYPHRDTNNDWRIVNATAPGDPYTAWQDDGITYVTEGARVKLRHVQTEKSLHSHDIRPPVSDVEFQNEVSGYGIPGYSGDANDDWIVEIHKGDRRDRESSKRVRTLRTQFRLKHPMTGCYLFSHKVKLPEWAFEQQEVTCNKQAVMANSLWYVETSTHPNCKSPFAQGAYAAAHEKQCPRMRRRSTTSCLASLRSSGSCSKSCGPPTPALPTATRMTHVLMHGLVSAAAS